MKTQSCKAKGRRLQQKIVSDLLERFPSLTSDDVRSTSMGAGGEDVQLSTAAQALFPYSVEAKNQERLNVWTAISQAKANSNGRAPIVVMKKNNEIPYVVLEWRHFLDLVSLEPAHHPPAESEPLSTRLRALADEIDAASRL